MNDPYEPSYYEIALTGRQVLAAFVILLVCLVAAFFSGVWVGRGGEGAEGERPGDVRAEADAGGEEERRLEELSFFEQDPMKRPRDPRDGGETAREPRPDTALGDDVEGSEPERGPAVPPAPRPAPSGTPPEGEAGETEGAGEGRRPPRRTGNPSGSLATGDIVIQVFSSSEEAKAREVLARLEKNGFRAFLSPLADDGRTLYRVRVGPFEHRSEAEEVAERLRSSLNMETWITQ